MKEPASWRPCRTSPWLGWRLLGPRWRARGGQKTRGGRGGLESRVRDEETRGMPTLTRPPSCHLAAYCLLPCPSPVPLLPDSHPLHPLLPPVLPGLPTLLTPILPTLLKQMSLTILMMPLMMMMTMMPLTILMMMMLTGLPSWARSRHLQSPPWHRKHPPAL